MNTTIRSIVPWFGSKRTLAPTIVEELGSHTAYWEPFCGSLPIVLQKPKSPHETVNDLHGDLINLAMVLASEWHEKLWERLRRTLYCEALFLVAQERFLAGSLSEPAVSPTAVNGVHVERAYWYFIVSWMGRNGCAGTKRITYQAAVRWTPNGGSGPTRLKNAVSSMPWWHDRLRDVCIMQRDAFELLPKIEDQQGVVIYVDPPYAMETRAGGSRYEHDFEDADHKRLAELLQRFKHARVVVSYYDHPAIAELYPGWTTRDVHRLKNLQAQNKRGAPKVIAPEVLVMNGPSYEKADNHSLWSKP